LALGQKSLATPVILRYLINVTLCFHYSHISDIILLHSKIFINFHKYICFHNLLLMRILLNDLMNLLVVRIYYDHLFYNISIPLGLAFISFFFSISLVSGGLQVSISSTLYARVFRTSIILAAFFLFTCTLRIRGKKLPKRHSYKKFVRKTLMKLTPDLRF
jgi:hypothetical protein